MASSIGGPRVDQAERPFGLLLTTFGDPVMDRVFCERATVQSWLDVERALAIAQGELGVIPEAAALAIAARIGDMDLEPGALADGTRHVGYPIVGLLAAVQDGAAPEVGAYLHWGATTQDIMDSGLALQLQAALARLETLEFELGTHIAALATVHRRSVMAARTHGQQAVPTTFGAKAAGWLDELARQVARLRECRDRVLVVSLFGAGGTGAAMGPQGAAVRHRVAVLLGLHSSDVPWHVARDGVAEACFVAASVSSTCVRIAREVIELARTEIGEVRETLSHGRGASSTMPQKANPILSEAVVGMGSIALSQMPAVLTAMQPRHERAAGEWQIEWDVVPAVFGYAAGSLLGTAEIVSGLVVDVDRMRANLDQDGGLIMAEALMMAVAPVAGRARAHELVYDLCARARVEGRALRDVVAAAMPSDVAAQLPPVAELLDPDRYVGEASAIVDAALAAWRRTGEHA